MEKVKSTCKVSGLYGVEIGEYAIILENQTVVYKPFPGKETIFEIVPDDSGTVEYSEEEMFKANAMNEQLSGIAQFAEESGISTSDVSTYLGDVDEEF